MASVEHYLSENPIAGPFQPYCIWSRADDTLTAHFTGEEFYSERLTAHVTIFRSMSTDDIIGCRIKGVSEITQDTPNRIEVQKDNRRLSVVFEAVRETEASPEVAESFDELGRLATAANLETVEC
jgi:hypothetical protein